MSEEVAAKLSRSVWCSFQFEGLHCWPDAPESVAYLRDEHRHVFYVCVWIEVYHNDRELEFITVKHQLENLINEHYPHVNHIKRIFDLGCSSCEDIAKFLLDQIVKLYPDRAVEVSVSEDGENGSCVSTFDCAKDVTCNGDLASYQEQAYQAIQSHANNKEEVMHWAIGLGEEAGEVLSVIKHRYYGDLYNENDLLNELGDVLWHVAALCTATGLSLETVAAYNLAKLQHRYPTGQFDMQRSIDRHALDSEFEQSAQFKNVIERKK